ncbi:hypothetical protein [Bombiscardovia apis]|uniref:hypothetical protein n=1 Tax=Bombiscardovia apis TaxID=2932182 RepID=UPI0029547F9E|nr:hypothetical protein [Bombiscardovia apis]
MPPIGHISGTSYWSYVPDWLMSSAMVLSVSVIISKDIGRASGKRIQLLQHRV